jgi:PrcB C-terminal
MNTNNKNKSAKPRPFHLLLALTFFAYPFLQCLTISASSAARTLHTSNKVEYAMPNTANVQNTYLQPGGIKVLAEGFHSKITKSFVAVVRDTETYAALIKLDENLPKLDADFFKENVVVAAFLGERNTGGYSVEITPSPVDINVLEKKPGKGVMVTQVITSPFKIVALEGASNAAVRLTLDEAWRRQMQFYRVIRGRFRRSGGFAGTSEEFSLEGVLAVLREGKLATVWLRIVGLEGKKRRLLMECSTGLTDGENKIQIGRMSADSLVDQPNSGLAGTARFNEGGKKLTLSLLSRPGLIADGYSGQGTIEAELLPVRAKPLTFELAANLNWFP